MTTYTSSIKRSINTNQSNVQFRSFWQYIHLDTPLLFAIFLLLAMGLLILYSASGQHFEMVERQLLRIGLSLIIMFVFAQISPIIYQRWALGIYLLALVLLVAVLAFGHIGKGAERWLNLGIVRFQPSEMMKLAIPMCLAWYFHKAHLPLTLKNFLSLPFIMVLLY